LPPAELLSIQVGLEPPAASFSQVCAVISASLSSSDASLSLLA
jgi:hypothetical protein